MFNLFSVLARNMTRTDALFHAGIAALLILGVTVGSSSGEMMWSSWNKGVGFFWLPSQFEAEVLIPPHSIESCPWLVSYMALRHCMN